MVRNVLLAFILMLFVSLVYEWGRLVGFTEASALCEVLVQ